jgi:hypothetical protein
MRAHDVESLTRAMARVLVACVVTGLAGCRPLMDISLASDAERLPAPRFSIEDPARRGAPLQYFSIEVVEDPGGAQKWFVFSSGGTASSAVTYGETPTGYTARFGPEPLLEGRKYAVGVHGSNEGTLHIVVDEGGAVRKDPAFR